MLLFSILSFTDPRKASPTFGWCSEDEDGVAEIVFTEM